MSLQPLAWVVLIVGVIALLLRVARLHTDGRAVEQRSRQLPVPFDHSTLGGRPTSAAPSIPSISQDPPRLLVSPGRVIMPLPRDCDVRMPAKDPLAGLGQVR